MDDYSPEKLHSLILQCPFCKAKQPVWSYFDSYSRYLISYEKTSVVSDLIDISRLICSSCGHTHAILPEIIIPYTSYSLFFILHVLRDYFLSHMTIQALCNKYQIAPSTLYSWKHLFIIHKKLWLGILNDLYKSSAEFLSSLPTPTISTDLHRFFMDHGHSFLQGSLKTAYFNST